MTIDLKALSEPLSIDQIDFRVQSINKGGYATILAYKDARVDMQRLDDVVGPLNWMREHINANHNCKVSIWCDSKGQWVSKEDTGTESYTESEKGLASDSFKRACFNWGIGRELYNYPRIQVRVEDDEWNRETGKATYKLRPGDWTWHAGWEDGELAYLSAHDGNKQRFEWYEETAAMVEAGVQINDCLDMDDYHGAAQIYAEWAYAQCIVIARAPSKGGQLSTQNREKLKSTEFRVALNEVNGIEPVEAA